MTAPQPQSVPDEFSAGTVFASKYCVERVIGRGGMGAVLAARHMDLGHRVAIKVLHEALASDPRATERFQREARASVSLESEHVAHVSDVGTDHGTSYMTMEYLEGEDLASVLKREGRIPQEQAVSWLLEACDAVAEAHAQGIIHRDLKPANLFLATRKRGAPIIKVLDFGISKTTLKARERAPQEELTETQAIVGTPHYASPEQLRGDQGLDTRSDIWSLGILLHRLLSGGRPFEAETSGGLISAIAADSPTPVREVMPEISEELEQIILKCLHKSPSGRYQDVPSLARALAPFAAPDHQGMVRHIEELHRSIPPEPSTRRQVSPTAQSFTDMLTSSGQGAHTLRRSPSNEHSVNLPWLATVGGLAALAALTLGVLQAMKPVPALEDNTAHASPAAPEPLEPNAPAAAPTQDSSPRGSEETQSPPSPEATHPAQPEQEAENLKPSTQSKSQAIEKSSAASSAPPVRQGSAPASKPASAPASAPAPRQAASPPPPVQEPTKAQPQLPTLIESDPYAD